MVPNTWYPVLATYSNDWYLDFFFLLVRKTSTHVYDLYEGGLPFLPRWPRQREGNGQVQARAVERSAGRWLGSGTGDASAKGSLERRSYDILQLLTPILLKKNVADYSATFFIIHLATVTAGAGTYVTDSFATYMQSRVDATH